MPFLASEGCFWPPTASMTSEVKNNYAYVITQDICNRFIEVNFCVRCMVLEPNRLLQRLTTMSLINKIHGYARRSSQDLLGLYNKLIKLKPPQKNQSENHTQT